MLDVRPTRPRGTGAAVVVHTVRQAKFELRCSSCGYGVVVRIAPEACPMCRGAVWEHPRRRVAALA